MPGGNRGIIPALFGLVLAAHHPNAEAQAQHRDSQERGARALESIATRYNEQAEGAKRSPESKPCRSGDDQRNSDLCAQWKAADAAADSAWWAAIGGFASAVSSALVLIALYLAFRSNWIARDTAKRQLRAYISVESASLKKVCSAGEKPQVNVVIKNTGQTPARELRIESDVFLKNVSFDCSFVSEIPKDYGMQVIGAGVTRRIDALMDTPLSVDDVKALQDGTKRLFFLAYGEYVDVFDAKQTFQLTYLARHPTTNIDFWATHLGNVAT